MDAHSSGSVLRATVSGLGCSTSTSTTTTTTATTHSKGGVTTTRTTTTTSAFHRSPRMSMLVRLRRIANG